MVENQKKHRQNSHPIIHCPTSEGVSEVSEQANESAAEGASEASSPEQANGFFLLLILGTSSYVALVAQLAAFKFQVTRIFLVISPLSVGRFQKNLDVT